MVSRGLHPNRFLTVHWQSLLGDIYCAAHCIDYQRRFFELARGWANKRGCPIAYLYVRENDFGDGSKGDHAHILLHIPEPIAPIFTRAMTRRWIKRAIGGPYIKSGVKYRIVGRRADNYINNKPLYFENLDHLLHDYMLKGANREAARALALKQYGKGGIVTGKRWGRSQNLR